MDKTKIDKTEKKIMVIGLIIGFIAQFFRENAMDIVILMFFIYLTNKYISTTENIKEYESYKFKDKEKFNKGKKIFALLVDIYIVIRIIYLIFNPQSLYSFSEVILIVMMLIPYEKYLEKKYVINTNIVKEKKTIVVAKKKVLISILFVIFIVFSLITFNIYKNVDIKDHTKYINYEYNLSQINDKRKIEINIYYNNIMVEEDEWNTQYFDELLERGKVVMKKQIIKSYLVISTVFMGLLCIVEIYPKDKKIESIACNIFLVCALIFSMLNLNFEIDNDTAELRTYLSEDMSR
ncbi:MAG: hypothetical protein ACRDD7_17000 [Peptostreptococcaceae bacterium]